jgi:hypothetical protein
MSEFGETLTGDEQLFESIAFAMDEAAGPGRDARRRAVFLAKLALLALRELRDPARAEALVREALADL